MLSLQFAAARRLAAICCEDTNEEQFRACVVAPLLRLSASGSGPASGATATAEATDYEIDQNEVFSAVVELQPPHVQAEMLATIVTAGGLTGGRLLPFMNESLTSINLSNVSWKR